MTHSTKRFIFWSVSLLLAGGFILAAAPVLPVSAAADCVSSDPTLSDPSCAQQPLSNTPAAEPVFTDATCTTTGFYVIPDTTTQFAVNGADTPAQPGTYSVPIGQTITIVEFIANPSEQQTDRQPAEWNHTFSAPSCTGVLGASTSQPVVVAQNKSTLMNTGTATLGATLLAMLFISAAWYVYQLPESAPVRSKK